MAVAISSVGKGGIASFASALAEKEKSDIPNSCEILIARLEALSQQNNNNDPDKHNKEMSHTITQQQTMRKLIGIPTLFWTNMINLVMAYLTSEPPAAGFLTPPHRSTPLTPEIASRILLQCLETPVDLLITDPEKNSPLSLNPQEASHAAIPYLKDIVGFSMQGSPKQLGLLAGQPLTQPLILLMSYPTMEKPAATQWVSCVIFPKEYQAPDGARTNNKLGEVIFYLDSAHTQKPPDMPPRFWSFYRLLTTGASYKQKVQGSAESRSVVIPPAFPSGMFYNASHQQQITPSTSLEWAVYNTMMLVLTGNTNFIKTFTSSNTDVNHRLNQLLHDLALPQKAQSNLTVPQTSLASPIPTVVQPLPMAMAPQAKSSVITPVPTPTSTPATPGITAISKIDTVPNIASAPSKTPSRLDQKIALDSLLSAQRVLPKTFQAGPISASTFVDTSSPIPPYSVKTLAVLLSAYGIKSFDEFRGIYEYSPSIKTKDFRSKEGKLLEHWDCYFYSSENFSSEMLLRDNILYFLKHKNKVLKNRRVCFVLQGSLGPLALILQLSRPNQKLIDIFKQQIQEDKIFLSSEISEQNALKVMMQWPLGLNTLKQMYGQVHAILLGSAITPFLVSQLKPLFEMAYIGKVSVDFKTATTVNPSIQLADDILQMLTLGETRKVPVPTAKMFSEHRDLCVKVFFQALDKLKEYDSPYIEAIIEKMMTLVKYLALEQHRARYPAAKANDTLDVLQQLQTLDNTIKLQIYGSHIVDMQRTFVQLDLAPIIEMLALKNKPERLLETLERGRVLAQEKLQAWETNLQTRLQQARRQQGWLPYVWQRSKQATQSLYQNSLVHLGSELVHWMGQTIAEVLPSRLKKEAREVIQRSVKWTVMGFTLSPRLARKSYNATGRLLKNENISLALKTSGAILGGMTTYTQGIYTTAKMLGMSSITLYCYHYMSLPRLLNKKASLQQAMIRFSPNALFRLTHLVVAMLEVVYLKNPKPFVQILGGISASIATTRLAQKCFRELQIQPGQRPTNDQIFIQLLLSMSAHDMGQLLAGYGYDACYQALIPLINKYRIIEQFKTLAEQQQMEDFTAESAESVRTNPLLWLSSSKVKASWRGQDGFYRHAECDINTRRDHAMEPGRSFGDGNGESILSCEILRLPPRLQG